MSNKLVSRLLSFTLSATVALTSGVPALAYDGGGGDLLEVEDEEIQLLDEEEEAGSDFDVLEEDIVEDEDEFFAIEEEEDEAEFETKDDVFYFVGSASDPATRNFGVYTVNGDSASPVSVTQKSDGGPAYSVPNKVTKTSSTLDDGTSSLIDFDSDNGIEIYVVPKTNYEISDLNLADAIKVEGSYAADDAAATAGTVTSIPSSAYSITKSTRTDVGLSGYDITSAYVVTILGNTDWLKGYKAAQVNDAKVSALTTDATVVKTLKVVIDNDKFTPKQFAFEVVGEDAGLEMATQHKPYSLTNTQLLVDVSGAVATANWSKRKVSVKLVKPGKDDIKFVENTIANNNSTSGKNMTSTTDLVYHVTAAHEVYISPGGVKKAISSAADGWTLTVAITDSSNETQSGITVYSESESFYTIKGINAEPNGTVECATANYDNTITSKAATTHKAWADAFYPFKITSTDTIGDRRSITAVKYSINGGSYVNALPFDTATGAVKDGSDYYNYHGDDISNTVVVGGENPQTVSDTWAHTAGYYAIPESALDGITEATTISIKTESTEKVTLTLSNAGSSSSYASLVKYHDANVDYAIGANVSAAVSSVATGKKYSFSVVPDNGYTISAVSATMYNSDGTGGSRLVLEEGDYGAYTSKTVVTGPVELTVTTAAQPVGKWNVFVENDASGARSSVKELKTGTPASLVGAGSTVKADDGKAFAFTVKGGSPAGVNYTVKKVEYTMGSTVTEKTELPVKKIGIDGTFYYQIDDVDGNVVLTITDEPATSVIKVANADAIITVDDQELADSSAAIVNQRENFKFKVAGLNGATVDAVYYLIAADATGIIDADSAGTKLEGTAAGVYEIGYGVIGSITTNQEIYITAVTTKPVPTADYSVEFKTDKADETDGIDSLVMYAGGSVATSNASDKNSCRTLTATVKNSKGLVISGGTSKWTVGKTLSTERIISLDSYTTDTPVVTSTKIKSTDTLTYVYKDGFPNAIAYTATLPVSTVDMSTMYADYELVPNVTVGGTYLDVPDTVLEATNTIRVGVEDPAHIGNPAYDIIKDQVQFMVYGNNYDEDGVKSTTSISTAGSTNNVISVTWSMDPELDATLNPQPYDATHCGCGHEMVISKAKKAGSFTLTALVTFADDSTTTVSAPVNITEETFGYIAVPVVTIGGKTVDYAASHALALNPDTAKTATVSWRVFEKKDTDAALDAIATYGAAWSQTEEGIKAQLRTGKIVEVPASDVVFEDAVSSDTTSTYITVAGKNSVTVTAKKKTGATYSVTPIATVNGLPVGTTTYTGAVSFTVQNDATTYLVKVKTDDSADPITDYQLPQMTSGPLASITPMSKVIGATSPKELYSEYDLVAVPNGTELTLPAQSAFDAATINPKRALYGWEVNGTYYKADGTQKVIINTPTTITALWAYKYYADAADLGSSYGFGQVQLFSEFGSGENKTHTLLSNGPTSTLTVANGKSVQVKVGYQALDLEAGPKASDGSPQYKKDWTYTSEGLTFTCEADPTNYNGVIAAPVNGLITSKTSAGNVTLKASWTDGTNTFSTFQTSGGLKAKTDGLDGVALTVSGAAVDTYTVKIDDITSGLAVGMTKKFPMVIKKKLLSNGTETTLTNKTAFANYQITSSNENVVKATIDTTASAGHELENILVTALGAGTATLTFTATDATGLVATTTANVTVSANEYKIVTTIENIATGTDGEVVAPGSEMGVLVGSNSLHLALMKGDSEVPTADGKWAVVASDPKTVGTKDTDDQAAWTTAGLSVSSNAVAITATGLGVKTLTVTYAADADTTYVREIPVRSYYAFVFNGPVDDEEAAAYEIKNGSTVIKKGKVSSVRIPYVDGTYGTVNTRKYQATLAGVTANQIGTFETAYDFKGWAILGNPLSLNPGEHVKIETDGSDIVFKNDESFDQTIAEYGFPGSGAYNLIAVFNAQDLKFTLPTVIELDDSNLSTTTTYGSDTAFVEFDITPITSTNTIDLTSTNKNKYVLNPDSKVAANTAKGYTTGLWNGSAASLTRNKGKLIDGSRTDAFFIAKYSDPALSKDYVGQSEIIVTANGDEYGTIPVYLNGEFKDDMNTATTKDDVIRYMYRGEVLKSGIKTVQGEEHYYKDSKLITSGILDVDVDGTTKKMLIIDSVWYKKAGAKKYEDKTYYVNSDGYLLTAGLAEVDGITRLFREDGSMVNYGDADVVDGKITVAGVSYVIGTDGAASFDDVLYNATVIWTKRFDSKYTKGTLPEVQYKISYTSKNSGKSATTEVKSATVTVDGDCSAESTAKELTFTATPDLSGFWKDAAATTPATAAPLTETYKFKNGGLEGTTGQEIGGEMMVEGLEDEYFFTGSAIKPVITVTDGDMVLAQGVDYTVKYKNNTKISSKSGDEYTKTAEVTVTGKGNYAGQGQTLYFAIIDPKDEVKEDDADLTGASIRLAKDTLYYTGEFLYPSAIELKLKGGSYVTYKHQGGGLYANDDGDIPAVVTFSNNINKGSATVMLTGKANAKGVTKTLKKTFKIKAAEMNTTDYTVTVDPESAAWAVKGAQPAVAVTWEGYDLVPGQDFTVSYDKSNKKVGPSKVTVKGKGNFAKKLEANFTVTALPLSEDMVAAVSALVGKKGAKVTLLDGVGNVIPTSLYTVSVFDGETDVTKTKLVADKDYTIKIAKKAGKTELGDDALEITAQAGIDIKSAKVNAKSVVKTYTGEAITLTDDDIAKIAVTYKGATLVAGTDYEITGYANNIKKGSMTVTIKGIGKYSGAKTFKVKIAPKPISSTN